MTGIIILAAGESRRLGEPKQNLKFQGKTLLQRAIETGLASGCRPVVVVLGANAEIIEPTIASYPVNIINNQAWAEGMASSIRAGIASIKQDKTIENVLVMLCDQPFVSPALIADLVRKQKETSKPVVACIYQKTTGVPVLFNRELFTDLLQLKGHEGAKKLIEAHQDEVASVAFDLGTIDIDTVEDYNRLNSH